jgi:lipoprotein-releasing system permease protein
MKVEFLIAFRHITSSGGVFKKIISGISIGGVAIGVSCLLIVTSVENGFHKSFKEKILATNPDIVVLRFHRKPIANYRSIINKISKIKHVQKVTPYVYTKGMLRSKSSQDGIILRGVTGENEVKNLEGTLNGIVLGKHLADRLSVFLFDTVTLYGVSELNPLGIKSRKFIVSGIFDAGLYEYTSSLAYLPMESVQNFLEIGDCVTGISIRLDNIYKAPEVAKIINQRLGYPYHASHWIELNTNLFAAMKLEKTTMFILLLLIIIVACFGISATLIMLITQKTREIGILRAIGATTKMIKKIFVIEGVTIGCIGSGIGVLIGWIVCFLLSKYQFISLPPGVYGVNTLPVDMRIIDFIGVGIGAIVISLLASLYPASSAAKLLPSEAIRYE